MATSGRPKIQPDVRTIERLARIGVTWEEMAAVLGCSVDTLQRRAKDDWEVKQALEGGRAKGRVSLRRLQWKLARAGNPAMLIWLGKHVLGQRDYASTTHSVDMPQPSDGEIHWIKPEDL